VVKIVLQRPAKKNPLKVGHRRVFFLHGREQRDYKKRRAAPPVELSGDIPLVGSKSRRIRTGNCQANNIHIVGLPADAAPAQGESFTLNGSEMKGAGRKIQRRLRRKNHKEVLEGRRQGSQAGVL